MIAPDALADETFYEDEDGAVAQSGVSRPRVARDPDAEALEIAETVFEKVAVARSLVRIFGTIAKQNAVVVKHVVRAYADRKMTEIVEREGRVMNVKTVTKAAKEAASYAAARAIARAQDALEQNESEEPRDPLST